MLSKIEAEVDRILQLEAIEPVQTAECSFTLVVPVFKAKRTVRICSNFKVTVDFYAEMQRIPFLS